MLRRPPSIPATNTLPKLHSHQRLAKPSENKDAKRKSKRRVTEPDTLSEHEGSQYSLPYFPFHTRQPIIKR
jgi:hypothetical protein